MKRALLQVRLIQTATALSIAVYAVIGEWKGQKSPHGFSVVYLTLVLAAACIVGIGHFVRRRMIDSADRILSSEPNNGPALGLWIAAHVMSFAVADLVALFGLGLRFLGSTFFAVLLFYLGGLFLLWVFRPARSTPVLISPTSSPQSVP
jgi:hypothetical protein